MTADKLLHAAYYCAAAEIRSRRRNGTPIPDWLRDHYSVLDRAIRFPATQPRQQSGSGLPQSDHLDRFISAAQAAVILGWHTRQVQRRANDLDGTRVGGRWLFRLADVENYRDELENNTNG